MFSHTVDRWVWSLKKSDSGNRLMSLQWWPLKVGRMMVILIILLISCFILVCDAPFLLIGIHFLVSRSCDFLPRHDKSPLCLITHIWFPSEFSLHRPCASSSSFHCASALPLGSVCLCLTVSLCTNLTLTKETKVENRLSELCPSSNHVSTNWHQST